MAVSYIGQATGTTSATLPAHQAGDLIIGFAFRDGSNTAASLPAGWTAIRNDGLNTCAGRLAYKIAASSSETSGTWTSATSVIFHVYRSAAIGANGSNTGSSTTINYPALTLNVTNGTSWVVGFAGHRVTNTALENPPTGMTNRSTVIDGTDEAAGHDTNGGVTSWTSQNVSAGGTASGYRSYVLEITDTLQTVSQSTSFTNTNEFYSGVITQPQSVTAPLLTNTNTFYTHTVIPDQFVVATTFVNQNEFGYTWIRRDEPSDAVIYNNGKKFDTGVKYGSFNQSITAPLLTNTNIFYSGVIETSGVTSPSFTNQSTFYNHTVTPGPVTVQAGLFQNTNTFYNHTVATRYSVSAPHYIDPDTFYTHKVDRVINQNTSFVNTNTFYSGSLGTQIFADTFVNTNTFYSATVKGRNQVLQASTLLNTPTFHRLLIQKAVFNRDQSQSGLPYIENSSTPTSPFSQSSGPNNDEVYIEN